ncbi:MAG: glycosyltransferase family 2 protein, partial [Planctomycetota bacterium]
VVDNGSTDATASVATAAGARVVAESRRGHGQACLTGLAALSRCDVVVFLDADYSDYPEQMTRLLDPIAGGAALVIGARTAAGRQAGALTIPQRFGNALACGLIRLIWGRRFHDLGPFRAVRWPALQQLAMRDRGYGWTVEMQIKAVACGLAVAEVPVGYRRRIGRSKISGTVRGVVAAGTKILATIARYALFRPDRSR